MSKPVLELFGVVWIDQPYELLIIAGFVAAVVIAFRKRKPKASKLGELSNEEIAQRLAVLSVAGSAPMTIFFVPFIVLAVLFHWLLHRDDLLWIAVIPLVIGLYFGLPVRSLNRELLRLPNYDVGLRIFVTNAKSMAEVALQDPWAQKRIGWMGKGVQRFIVKYMVKGVK